MTNEVRELFDFVRTNGMSVLWDYGGSRSRAASSTETETETETEQEERLEARTTELINGVFVSKPLEGRGSKSAASATRKAVTKYDMSGPPNPNQVYKCGIHDYETKSLTEFNQHIESHDHSSKAASSIPAVNEVRELFDFLNGRFE